MQILRSWGVMQFTDIQPRLSTLYMVSESLGVEQVRSWRKDLLDAGI